MKKCIKELAWKVPCDTADILYDIHQVIRHQLWLDRPESEKSHITVDASEAMQVGDEPLAIIERKEV